MDLVRRIGECEFSRQNICSVANFEALNTRCHFFYKKSGPKVNENIKYLTTKLRYVLNGCNTRLLDLFEHFCHALAHLWSKLCLQNIYSQFHNPFLHLVWLFWVVLLIGIHIIQLMMNMPGSHWQQLFPQLLQGKYQSMTCYLFWVAAPATPQAKIPPHLQSHATCFFDGRNSQAQLQLYQILVLIFILSSIKLVKNGFFGSKFALNC